MIGSTGERKKTAIGFWQAEESEGTVANRDTFEVEALGWYLKT